jgi:hypothetical protein
MRGRGVTRPDAARAALPERLGIVLPNRIRVPQSDPAEIEQGAA